MKKVLKILIHVMIILFINLTGCGSNSEKTSNQWVENISEIKTDDLLKYKGSYVGDNTAVGNIISRLPANAYNGGFSLETKKAPYGITVNYMENLSLGTKDYYNFWDGKNIDEFLEKNAVAALSLIKNADFIEFKVAGLNQGSYKYTRKYLEQKYGGDLKNISKDGESFKKFVNNE